MSLKFSEAHRSQPIDEISVAHQRAIDNPDDGHKQACRVEQTPIVRVGCEHVLLSDSISGLQCNK